MPTHFRRPRFCSWPMKFHGESAGQLSAQRPAKRSMLTESPSYTGGPISALAEGMSRQLRDLAARYLLQPLYRSYRKARPSLRPEMQARLTGLRFRRDAEWWSDERKRTWMLQQLRAQVRRAWRETEFYCGLFARVGFDPQADFGFDDFARLPVLERAEVRNAGQAMVSTRLPRDQLRRNATGGSTGTPTELWMGPEERGWNESGQEYAARSAGFSPGGRIALLWGHHLDPTARTRLIDRAHDFVDNVRWFDCLRLSPDVLNEYHRELEQWRPQYIVAYASSLAALAEEVERRGHRPSYPKLGFITGAEKLLSAQRATVQRVFGRLVHERYGGRDVGQVAFQHDPAQTLDFKVDWSNILLEPETGDESSAILVTKLHADGMPMLRYRIGDIGRFPEGSRPGWPTLVLREVIGRETDRLWMPDGSWAHGLGFPHMLKDYPVRDFQVVQRASLDLLIRIVPKDGFDDRTRNAILQLVRANLPGIPVEIALVTDIPRTKANKWRPVISEVESPPRVAAG